MLNPQSQIVRSTTALAAEMRGEIVILNTDRNEYVHIDAIGSQIWDRFAEPVSIEDVAHALAGEYDAGVDTIRKDVTEFAERMIALGLLQTA